MAHTINQFEYDIFGKNIISNKYVINKFIALIHFSSKYTYTHCNSYYKECSKY